MNGSNNIPPRPLTYFEMWDRRHRKCSRRSRARLCPQRALRVGRVGGWKDLSSYAEAEDERPLFCIGPASPDQPAPGPRARRMKPPGRGDLIDGPEEGEVMDAGTAAVGLSIASA